MLLREGFTNHDAIWCVCDEQATGACQCLAQSLDDQELRLELAKAKLS